VKRVALWVAVAALCAAPARPARAQSADELLTQGIAAYQQLQFDAAAQLLARSLGPDLRGTLSDARRLEGLTYLAASQLFSNHQESASATLREILLTDPRYEPDSLLFPPPVRSAFAQVRDSVKVVILHLPAQSTLLVGRDTLPAHVYASSLHQVTAVVDREDGALVRSLYQGPILDSLTLWWDGRDAHGAPVAPGSYRLTVVSRGQGGQPLRSVMVPLDITASHADTIAYAAQPPDSLFLPQRTSATPGLAALGVGLLGAGLTAILPQAVGAGSDGSARRFLVAAAVGLAGIVGLRHRGLGRPIPANVAANAIRRDVWRRQIEDVQQANRVSRAGSELHIQAGPPARVEGRSR
jgi:FlgD Ig-like domain